MDSSTEPVAPKSNAYGEYLWLSQILEAQHPRSVSKGDPVPDETLFIVIHQAIELWFYQVIHDLRSARNFVKQDKLDDACDDLVRVARIFAVLTLSWDVLATLRVREFWKFRKYFMKEKASGLQSKQFREVEFLLGVGPKKPSDDADEQDAEGRSLWDEVISALGRRGVVLPEDFVGRDWRTPYRHSFEDEKGHIHGDPVIEDKWFEVYNDPSNHRDLYQLGERLLDVAGAVSNWRSKHIATVQRFIGDLAGSGGTDDGVRYLRKTLAKRAFPELSSVRNRFKAWLPDDPEPTP